MRNSVIINGITLTREQIVEAYTELNAPLPDLSITIPHALARRVDDFATHNITVPQALDSFPWALTTKEMHDLHVILWSALDADNEVPF